MTDEDYPWDRSEPVDSDAPITRPMAFDSPPTSSDIVPLPPFAQEEDVVEGPTEASVPGRHPRVEVARDGSIDIVDAESPARETVAEVTGDTFYGLLWRRTRDSGRFATITGLTMAVDLNAIADAVKEAQRNDGQPDDPTKHVYVGREGELFMGDDATGGERIAEVTSDTFYSSGRIETESSFVRSNMPRNTVRVSDGTYSGWHFSITNEFGDKYSLFLYYHEGYGVYRVALVEPRLGGSVDPHGSHLWPDGTLCLTKRDGSGYPSMAATYAKAALWTRGASCYRRGHGFQFNVGQD